MYSYIKGIIVAIGQDHIVLDHSGIGYHIFVSNPYSFKIDDVCVVYIYQQVREDALTLFGFKTKEEKSLFLKLIMVKGIGAKTALGILATNDVDHIISAIEQGNITFLKKIPGIGPKAASQIILDLKGKLVAQVMYDTVDVHYEEAVEVLKALGYKMPEIQRVMKSLSNQSLDTNSYVKKALGLLVK